MYLNATLFAQIAVFIILALFTMKFVWPPIVKALDERSAKIAEGLAAAIPLGRLGVPDDYPGMIAFLLSDDAAWMTGQTVVVDGGILLQGGI